MTKEVKITKGKTIEFVKNQLSTSEKWVLRALVKIYEFQTEDEKEHETTHDYNGVGFTGVDGEILTSFAKQYLRKNYLSQKQMAIVFKKMPKYWRQIMSISDENQLKELVAKSLNA